MNKKAKQDIFVCLVIYAFMLFCFVQTFSMKSGSATMPRLILSLAFICNTALTVRTIGQLKKNPGGEGYTSISEIKVPMLMFLGVVLYCLIFNFTNYFVATAIIIPAFMLVEKVRPVWKVVLIDVGNHRLQAMEQLVSTGQISSTYLIPFCLILFADTDSLKDEKVIFHNINSKAVPLKSEQLLKSVLIQQHDGLDFNDRELIEKFGPEYLLARKILSANPLTVRKLGYIEWIHPRILSTLVDLINYVQEKSGTRIETLEQQEALINSLNNTLRHAHPLGAAKLQMASGLLFLLVYMYYQMENGELDPQNKAEKEKNQLIAWAEKYNITDAQHDIEQYAAVNADCIRAIFDKYVLSTEQTIFMSRCFDSRFDENERAIRRAIEYVNREKGSSLRLLRVDQHSEGATGQISDRILRDIEMSGLVIADLSSGRANIPHEIGFAMGLKKGLILIHNGTDAEADEHTPSNIKMYEQIRFNQDYHKLETELKAKLIDYYKL